ncbi:MAG: nodulation protein NfeD [Dissulfurispiraceae bacterium]|jgi:membrane-bound serine protease (ClpP class)|nr:nodulation protein NfeD [Dissulfurispiraceae bacterium]
MKTRLFTFILLIASLFLISGVSFSAPSKKEEKKRPLVTVITVDGVINPVAAEHIHRSIKKALSNGSEALIVELDTPGGLDTSMRLIVKDIFASEVPVIVFVSPSGARAASAGVFITMSAHIAAMAPGTNMGAAHPVAVGEKMDKVTSDKAANDAAAYIKSIAESRGRNIQWAESAVRKSVSITEAEALKLNVIDMVQSDLKALLAGVDGKKIKTAFREVTLRTADADIERVEMGFRHKVLDFVSNPNVAYILMMLGFYGIFFELTNPGSLVPGILGGISLVLAFYAFQTLPVNYAGLLLIVIGIILFILEIKVTSYGLLSIGGIGCVVLGSIMLIDSPDPIMKLSLSVVLPAALVTALFFGITIRLAFRAFRRRPVTGVEGLVGIHGAAISDIGRDSGQVMIQGEIWSAYSEELIPADAKIIVESVEGLRVKVKRF